jgi:NitT/TauT family transport system substrate-binding protein
VTSKFSLQPLASLRLCLSKVGGVTMDEIHFLNDYASLDAAAQAFRDGVGDFVHLQDPLASLLMEEGVGCAAISVGESLGELAFSTLAMSRKFLEERSGAAEAFMRAYFATLQWLAGSDPEEIVAVTQGLFQGVPRGVLVRSVQNCKAIGAWQPDPVIRREPYERMVDMWILAGHMTKRYPFERVVNNDLAEKIEREWKAGA